MGAATAPRSSVTVTMKYNRLFLMAAVCVSTAIAPIAAQAQSSPADRTTTTRTSDDRDDDKDYGWIGLLGLLGLAGLMKKKNDHRHDTTVSHNR
jgi:hypothetical protein